MQPDAERDQAKEAAEESGEAEEAAVARAGARDLKYGMTSGLVVEGEGAAVGEAVMATWLEHVWFRHVPPTNFLLADSYHIHTAQQTQKILLEVKEMDEKYFQSFNEDDENMYIYQEETIL